MTLSIVYVRALVEAVERAGVAKDELLSGSGLDAVMLDDTSRRVGAGEWNALLERALDRTEDLALGLHMGELASATTYGIPAHLVAHSGTMRDGLDALTRFYRLLSDTPLCELREDGARALLVHELIPGPPRIQRFQAELALVSFFRMVRYFGRGATPHEVAFAYPAPHHRAEYTRVFEGRERFDRSFTGVAFDRRLLGSSQVNQDPDLLAALHTQAERRAALLDGAVAYAEKVRAYLVTQTNPGSCDMEMVAHAVGLSARSLRRRLGEEGASFADIVRGARAEVAKGLVLDDDSIQRVASTLGFSDPSAFHHAFKKWTGMTPREYRLWSRNPNAVRT